jgi:anti-sigma factor RsiW
LAGHPDLDTLADLDAGLLDPPAAAQAGRHVASCRRCSAALAALGAVRVDLRSLPPPALPPAVAARLDDTFAQLRQGRLVAPQAAPNSAANARSPAPRGAAGPAPPPAQASAAAAGPRPPAQVVDLAAAQEQRRARARRLTGRVAASVVVAAALVGVGTAIVEHTDDHATIAQGNALPADRAASSGRGGTGGGTGEQGKAHPDAGSASPPAVPSYTEDTLLAAIPAITTRSAVDIITGEGLNGPAGPMADSARRGLCAASIPGANGIPVAVQRVFFDDQSAYVFVFTGVTGTRTVVVVSADCGQVPVPQVLFRHQG